MTDLKMTAKRVAELEVAQLDWAVAKALGIPAVIDNGLCQALTYKDNFSEVYAERTWLSWEQGGPIIEREGIVVSPNDAGLLQWRASIFRYGPSNFLGPTPLIAAMRAFVASKLGDVVEVPE